MFHNSSVSTSVSYCHHLDLQYMPLPLLFYFVSGLFSFHSYYYLLIVSLNPPPKDQIVLTVLYGPKLNPNITILKIWSISLLFQLKCFFQQCVFVVKVALIPVRLVMYEYFSTMILHLKVIFLINLLLDQLLKFLSFLSTIFSSVLQRIFLFL